MDIIDEDARFCRSGRKRKQREPRGGMRHGTKRLASCRHLGSWGVSAASSGGQPRATAAQGVNQTIESIVVKDVECKSVLDVVRSPRGEILGACRRKNRQL